MQNEEENNGAICPAGLAWENHLDDFKMLMQEATQVFAIVRVMHEDIKHLQVLPDIAHQLRDMNNNLVGPATSKTHIPLIAFLPIISAMAFCMVILGGLLFSHLAGETRVRITPNSIETMPHNP